MGKNVFRSTEIDFKQHKVFLRPPQPIRTEEPEALEAIEEEYSGPTADQLRREAELFKSNWDAERQRMIDAANEEVGRVVKEAEDQAFRLVRDKTEQAQQAKTEAEAEAQRIKSEAEAEAARIIDQAQLRAKQIEQEAFDRGRRDGEEAGITEGKAEVQRVIDRFHIVLSKAIERRNEIIEESESQVVSLVLSIAKKVVKVISENQRNVVINNVMQSLQKLRAKSDVIIRVNLADLSIATKHKEDIVRMAERVRNITIAEDTTVDPGGCIIETDFGEIDARITSQLREIEDRILELAPVKTRPKGSS